MSCPSSDTYDPTQLVTAATALPSLRVAGEDLLQSRAMDGVETCLVEF